MIILGIDPAIRATGYGVIELKGNTFEIIDCGVIANSARLPHSQCVRRLFGGIRELVKAFQPAAAVLEEPFMGKNASTAIILGMARGAILASLAEHEIQAFAYAPSKAKKAAVGSGSASKEQVAVMMAAQLGISIDRIPLDATDALALAICHGQLIAAGDELAGLLTKPI